MRIRQKKRGRDGVQLSERGIPIEQALRALQPVLTTAIISLVAGVVLLVLPRFETDSDVRSMTPE